MEISFRFETIYFEVENSFLNALQPKRLNTALIMIVKTRISRMWIERVATIVRSQTQLIWSVEWNF